MSDFLENLKKAADTGEFNSEAAKKILEVHDLADAKLKGKDVEEELENIKSSLEERAASISVEPVSEEKVAEASTEYAKKMAQFKKLDAVNVQLATLIEIEDMVKLSIEDMFSFTEELENKFEKEFEAEDPMFGDLFQKIESIKSKYNSIIN